MAGVVTVWSLQNYSLMGRLVTKSEALCVRNYSIIFFESMCSLTKTLNTQIIYCRSFSIVHVSHLVLENTHWSMIS